MELNENKSDWKLKIAGKPTKLFVKKVFFIETNLSNPSKPKSVLKSLANNPKYYKVQAKDAESLQKVDDWLQTQPTPPQFNPCSNWLSKVSTLSPEKSQQKSQPPMQTSIKPLDLRPPKQTPLYAYAERSRRIFEDSLAYGQKNLANLPQPQQTKVRYTPFILIIVEFI